MRALAGVEFDPRTVAEFFVCGPGSMVSEVTAALREVGAEGRIHVERFSAERASPAPEAAAPMAVPATVAAADAVEVAVTMDGRRRTFSMPRDGLLLEAAERAGLALPYSCRAGVCSTCRVRVTEGTVAMDRNQALEDWETQAGFVLCCQARPRSAHLELSYDTQ